MADNVFNTPGYGTPQFNGTGGFAGAGSFDDNALDNNTPDNSGSKQPVNQGSDTPTTSQQLNQASAKALNAVADFSDGKIALPGEKNLNGNLKENAGQFIASGTYRQDDTVYGGFRRMEKAAAFLTLASGNYIRSENAADQKKFIANGGENFVKEYGILSDDVVGTFRKATGITLTEEQIQSVSKFGFYETTPIQFDAKERETLTNFLSSQSAEDKLAVHTLLGVKGVTVKDESLLGTMTLAKDIAGKGSFSEKVKVGSAEVEKAKRAISDKEMFNSAFHGKGKKSRADSIEYIREKTVQSIGLEEFTGSKKQLKELSNPRSMPVRDTSGHVIYVDEKQKVPKMENVRGFTNKKGNFVRVEEEKYNEIMDKMGVVGATKDHKRSEQVKKGQVEKAGTAVLNDDAKTGLAFTKSTVKVTAKTAATAYRAAALTTDNIKLAAHTVANAGVGIASLGVSVAGKLGIADVQSVQDAKNALKNAKTSIKDSKAIAKGDKKSRKDIFKEDKNVRNAKRRGNKLDVQEAKNKRDALKRERKSGISDRRESAYRSKHNGEASPKYKRREARNNRRGDRLSRRKKRIDNLKKKKPIAFMTQKWSDITNSRTVKALSKFGNGVKKVGGAVGGAIGKVVKAPLSLYNRIYDFFSNIKKVIIKYLGLAGLWFLIIYLILCLVLIVVGAIASFFSFVFADNTNYGQLLVADMKEMEESFLDMAKYDGVNYYKDAADNADNSFAQNRVIKCEQYGDGTLVITEVAENAKIRDYYVSYSGQGNYQKTDSLGSVVPYFGIMRHRYMAEEIGGELYGLAKAQMYNLWIKAHTIEDPISYDYTLEYHNNLADCKDLYKHETTSGYENYPKDEKGQCNNYTSMPKKGVLNCQHYCDSSCYEQEITWLCGYDLMEKMEDGSRHYHNYKCGYKIETIGYDCQHECEDWKSEADPGCYTTEYEYVCNGHCKGIICPVVDIYYTDSIAGIAALDIDRMYGGKYSSFHPSHKLEKDQVTAYPTEKYATKRYTESKIVNEDGWVQYWNRTFREMNAESSSKELTHEGIDTFTTAKYRTGFDEYYVLDKFPNSYRPLSASDIEDIRSMIGDESSGYVEGVENWAEFDVYFAESSVMENNKETRAELTTALKEKYGIDLADTSKRSIQIINSAINNAGKISFNDDLTASQGSLKLVNTLLIAVNEKAYPDFEFYEKKAKKTVKDLKLLMWQESAGVANQYDHMRPGAILVNPEREKVGIYLGMIDENKCRILDYAPGNTQCGIYVIGIDELDTRYTKAISASDIDNDKEWISESEKKKYPWPNDQKY